MKKLYFLSGLLCLIVPLLSVAKADVDIIKQRVIVELMKPEVDDAEIDRLVTTIKDDGTWPGINYEDVSRTGFQHFNHSGNLVLLARSYQKQDSKFYKSKKVKKTLELALNNWVDNDYICDNWWHNQIGVPNHLVTVMMIVGDQLPKELVDNAQPIIGRAHIDAPGARPGGDRIKISGIQAKNCLFIGDDETFAKVVKVIEGEIKYVAWIGNDYGYSFKRIETGFKNRSSYGRGIQYDNSFHHRADGVNNTLSYGLGYADAFVEWAVYTTNTQYSFSDEKLERLIDYYLDGICKTAIYGKFPDPGAKNRSISRRGTLKAYNASTAEKLILTSDYRKAELQEIVDIRSKSIKPTLSHATFYWNSEHFTFQRPDYFTSVRMYSTRTYNMEVPYNSEGLLNHHRGDGANHISVSGDEYFDIAPVFDYQKIPGATIIQKANLPSEKEIQKLGFTDFVGAATDGTYAAVAFDFRSPHDPLVARKSWFFFDKEYVCLGAGISTRQQLPVVTTLNQCLLKGDVTVSVDNEQRNLARGEYKFDNVDWVYQDGVGYVFPDASSAHVSNNKATGSWYKINRQSDSPKDEVVLDVFKLWVDHGPSPIDAKYQYIVVPATSIAALDRQASKNNINILSNTPYLQAVAHKGLQIYQMVFYKSGEIELSDGLTIRSDSPGIVMIKLTDNEVSQISVSDPNRELGRMNLVISANIEKSGDNFSSVWNHSTNESKIWIDLKTGVHAGSSTIIDVK